MSPATPSRTTLADVLGAIATVNVPDRRRQDLASAVRTAAKALGQPPGNIPADPRLLGKRLKAISPITLGLTPGRWSNVQSLLGKALTLVTTVMVGRDDTPLSAPWAVLFDIVRAKHSDRARLSRIVHWLSRHEILPQAVTLADLKQFKTELLSEALLKDPEATWTGIVQAWNHAVLSIAGWPQLKIERKSRVASYVMPWSSLPSSLKLEVDASLAQLAGHDLASDGPARPLRPASLAAREYMLRAFASALALRGRPASSLTSLAFCLTMENYREGLQFFYERYGRKTTTRLYTMAATLKGVARYWLKADASTLDEMTALAKKLAIKQIGLTQKNRDRLRPFRDPETARRLVCLPQTIRDSLIRSKAPLKRKAMLAQMAVAIEILLFAPIRIKNLAALDIDRHLIPVGDRLHLVIPADEVKNHRDLEFELPARTAALIAWYRKEYRGTLPNNKALFPGAKEAHKAIVTLRSQIIETVQEYIGLHINPHLFRHIGALLYLDQNPGGYEVMRRVLSHGSMATTTNFYTGLETHAATRHFDAAIIKIGQSVTQRAVK